MTTNQPQPAQDTLGRLATYEHLLSVVTQLAGKWHKHMGHARTADDGNIDRAMAAAYCKSLAILLDRDYMQVWHALEKGDL